MGNLTSTDMIIIFILIAVIFVLIGIILILDIMNKKKKQELIEEEKKENLILKPEINKNEEVVVIEEKKEDSLPVVESVTTDSPIKENKNRVEEIKYVEEDEELEKTKAKIELEQLKEELRRQEEMKRIALEKAEVAAVEEKEEVKEEIIENGIEVEPIEENKDEHVVETKDEVATIANAINEELIKEEAKIQKVNEVQEDLNELLEMGIDDKIALYEDEQEEKAIISVEEFNKISDALYDSNELVQNAYQDEGDEPITIEELYSTREMKVVKLDDFDTIKDDEKEVIINNADIKSLDELPPIAMEKKFKSSPFISPVYGISETKDSIELEQTANLDKLNDEIKKTNEFLKTLRELQKNLD